MRNYMEEYKYWLDSNVIDEETRKELESISGNESEIEGRFSHLMTFGTGGLRQVMRAGISTMNVYTVRHATQALSNVVKKEGGKSVTIAFDSRNNSQLYAKESACVLAANGIKAYLFESLRPTPELSFAVRETGSKAGINITASHNAKEYNGYKVYWEDGGQIAVDKANEIAKEIESIDIFASVLTMDYDVAVNEGMIEIIGKDIDEKYLENVLAQSVGSEFVEKYGESVSIVYTPFHGAGYKLVPEVLKRIGIKIIPVEEQMIVDGNFPTVKSPNPENREGFKMAIECAKKHEADIVIGTDPDSDRCGCAVRNGSDYEILSGNKMACLMLDYLISVKKENKSMPVRPCVCKSIVSTLMADKICRDNNVSLVKVLTGFKFIGEKIMEFERDSSYDFLFGFEESLGFLTGTYTRDKDAILASMLLAEIVCYYKDKGMTVYEGLQALYDKYGYFEELNESIWFEGYDAQEKMSNMMVKLRNNPPSTLGNKVINVVDYMGEVHGFSKSNVLEYELSDGCQIYVRPSGTEPRVKTYLLAQGASRSDAKARLQTMSEAINKILKG